VKACLLTISLSPVTPGLQGPGLSVGAGKHAVGGFVVREPFGGGVPVEVAAEAKADVAKVGDGDGAMRLFNGGDGLLAREDAVDEVTRVAGAAGKADLVRSGRVVEEAQRAGFDGAPVDPYGALRTLKGDTLPDAAGADELDAGGVERLEVEVGSGVPEFLLGPGRLAVANGDRPSEFRPHPPLGDVGMVAAPIGDLAARIVENPSKVHVAAAGGVWSLRGGPEPHVVVEARGNGFGILTMAGLAEVRGAAGETAQHGVEFAETAVANQFAGLTEAGIGTLLRAGLEDALVILNGVDHGAALADGQRQGLLAVNILAGAGGGDGGQSVPMVREGDEHGVDIGAAEQVAEVFVDGATLVDPRLASAAVMPFDEVAGGFAPGDAAVPVARGLPIDIANGHDLDAFVGEEELEVIEALIATANDAEGDAAARRWGGLEAETGGRKEE